jgi:CRISPR type III-A-associated RAMP protein Csm4
MVFECVKMNFKSALHISKGSEAYDKSASVIHADMIQSAIFVCALQLFGKEFANEDFFKSFQVSSAFPFLGAQFFFPKPLQDAQLFGKADAKELKEIKKVSFLPQNLFEKALSGEQLSLTELGKDKKSSQTSEVTQRVTIPREGNTDATPFFMDRVYFSENAGLFFLIKFLNEELKEKVKAAVKLLGENGIGTDKNIGQGVFEPNFDSLELKVPDFFTHSINLGTYIPGSKEDLPNLESSFYGIIKRGGWIANPDDENNASLRKRSVYMFSEGSVFAGNSLAGKIVDLKPDGLIEHSVWRDGRGFFVPMKLNQ